MGRGLDGGAEAELPARLTQIIDAAAEEFARNGFSGASIQSIADAVGMLKGSLYHYIGTKSDLLFFVARDVANGLLVGVEETLDHSHDPGQRLRLLVARHIRYNANNLTKARVAIRESHWLQPEHRAQFRSLQDQYEHLMRRVIVEGQESGHFRSDVSPTIAAMAILSVCNYLHEWYRPTGEASADDLAAVLATLALEGISAR
jgi:AcrR family transcriptional regulator